MRQIIKEGTKKITKCECCGCEFSYEQEDLIHKECGANILGNKHGFKIYVVCPQCEDTVLVEQTK